MDIRRLVEFRKNRGISQDEMAKMLGFSLSYYQKIEQGDRNPSFEFIRRFKSQYPDVDMDYVLSDYIDNTAPHTV